MSRSALLFDFDGTLADSLPLCLAALRAALLRHTGRIHADREITAHYGVSEDGIFQRLVPGAWEAAVRTYHDEYERSHQQLCPALFPGIPELLSGLRRRGVRMGLITGKGPKSAEIAIRLLGLGEWFEEVRTGSPTGDVKAGQIRELVDRFQVPLARAAYVGDFPSDVRASRAAGVRALAAAWAPAVDAAGLAAEHPDLLLRSTAELQGWVDGWLAGEEAGARPPVTSAGR